jgi:hypothetical protein
LCLVQVLSFYVHSYCAWRLSEAKTCRKITTLQRYRCDWIVVPFLFINNLRVLRKSYRKHQHFSQIRRPHLRMRPFTKPACLSAGCT